MSKIDQQTPRGTVGSESQVVPVQGDGLRPYPYTRDRECRDPDQHGFPDYCLICGMNGPLPCLTKVKHGRLVTWHSHPVEIEDGVEHHNVVFTASGKWEVNRRIQRPDGKQESPVPIKRADWVTRLNQDGGSCRKQTAKEVNK